MTSQVESGPFSVDVCVEQLAHVGIVVDAVYGGRAELLVSHECASSKNEAPSGLAWVFGVRLIKANAGPSSAALDKVLIAYEARYVAHTVKAYCADPQHPFFDYVFVVHSSAARFAKVEEHLSSLFGSVPVAFSTSEHAPWVAPQDLSFLRGIALSDWMTRSKVHRLKFWLCTAREAQGLLVLHNKDLILLPGSLTTTRDPNPGFIRPMRQIFESAINTHFIDKAHGTWCVQAPLRVVDKALAASLLIQGLGRADQWTETSLEDIPMSLYERVEQAMKSVRAFKGPGSLKDEEIPEFFKHRGR